MTPSSKSSNTHNRKAPIQSMTMVALITAVTCIIAPFSIPLPFSPIPISMCTLAIYFAIVLLGKRLGFLSILLYILLGLVGLPVFSGFTGGIGKLLGPTGGYIIGYLLLALIFGSFVQKWSGSFLSAFAGMLLGTAACYSLGTLWLAYQSGISIFSAFLTSVLPFLPGDFCKMLAAWFIGKELRKRLTRAGLF